VKSSTTVFDGGNCIGGNKIHLQAGETGIFLDFGLNFKTLGMYFEEFLKPRTATHGIQDLIALGIIPPFEDIYREDAIIPGMTIKSGMRPKVDAVFISHAHVDHTGSISLIRPDIPVYGTHMTAVICKAMQDCSRGGLEGEVAYYTIRVIDEKNPDKITKKSKDPCISRSFSLVDRHGETDSIQQFWCRPYSGKELIASPLINSDGIVKDIPFEAIPVDHSIYGATCYVFDVGGRSFVYTGDFRLHGRRQEMSDAFVRRIKQISPDYLMVEGTNMGSHKGNDTIKGRRASEDDVYLNCLKATKDASGRLVIADFGPRNIERLEIFVEIARETQRHLVITPKDAFMLYAMNLADPNIPDILADDVIMIYDSGKSKEAKWESGFIRQEFSSKYITPKAVKAHPEDHILAFSFFDIANLLDIQPDGGIYIYSTCEAFSEEMVLDVWRLGNWLEHFGIEPVGFKIDRTGGSPGEAEIEFTPGYHASGHVSADELIDLIYDVKPKAIIPVHTEHPEIFADRFGKDFEVILPRHGVPIEL
jgi:ribonuclease J